MEKLEKVAVSYMPPKVTFVQPAGRSGVLRMQDLIRSKLFGTKPTMQDLVVAEALIRVLSGGECVEPLSEDALVSLEREAFIKLFQTPATRQRVRNTLATGKPLRN